MAAKIASTYVHEIVPDIVKLLCESGQNILSQQELQFFAETIKFMLYLHTQSPNGGFLFVFLPTLVSLLTPNAQGSLHGTALQLILQFASTHAQEVAQIIEALPMEKKQILQYAIQLSAQQQQELEQQRANARAGKGRLTLDASKFG